MSISFPGLLYLNISEENIFFKLVSPVTPFFLYRTQRTMANKLSQYRYLPMIHWSFFLIRQTQQLSLLLQSITFPCSWCNNLFIYTSIFLSIFLFVFESVSKAHSLNIRSARASMSSSLLINISKNIFCCRPMGEWLTGRTATARIQLKTKKKNMTAQSLGWVILVCWLLLI